MDSNRWGENAQRLSPVQQVVGQDENGRPLTVDDPDFRAYSPQQDSETGTIYQECADLIAGRWEGFVAILEDSRPTMAR